MWPWANGEIESQNISLLQRLNIYQVERNMYRSSQHTTTGVSSAELLFRRKIRTTIPQLEEFNEVDVSVRDRGDHEQKERGKMYADVKRSAKTSDIKEGDQVLLRKNKENKLYANFHSNRFLYNGCGNWSAV